MDAAYERPASTSSYFARPAAPHRLLLCVYAAEGLRHVSSHGTYCKLYVGGTEMVRGSGAFARRTQKLTLSASTHSLGGLLHSPFGTSNGNSSRGNTAQPPNMAMPPTSSSEGDLSGNGSRMRVLKTQVQKGKRSNPVWNEKFDIPVLDPNEDVLSIRVKSARLMSSPAIGACSIPLKYLTLQGAATADRWIDLKIGKKDAGRIRLQLRLVDPSARIQSRRPDQDNDPAGTPPSTTRPRNHQNSDSYLSLPAEESPEEVAARAFKKTSRRDHKYHRSARHFDGRPVTSTVLGSSDGSNRSASDKEGGVDDQKHAPTTPRTPRDNSASATSNESIDDSEPASDVSASPAASPLPKRASNEDASVFSDSESTSAVTRPPRTSFNSLGEASEVSTPSPPVATVAAGGLDASYAHRGTMRRSELERSRMKMAEISRTSRVSKKSNRQVPQEEDDDDDSDLDEYGTPQNATKRWTGNHTKLSVLSSTLDPRESSRMDFDDDDIEDPLDNRKKSVNYGSSSVALSSTATSTLDPRGSSRFGFSDSESDGEEEEEEENDEVKSEKAREQQRQQWQMEQRKKQLAGVKEESQSMSDSDSDEDSDNEDEYDEELELESPRMQFTPTIAKLLCRESMNVLIEEEDEEEEESLGSFKMSEEFVPILEATSPMSVASVDCALHRSSFD